MSTHSPVMLSVVVPTYNGANRIPDVLDRLAQQHVDDDVVWNIWVVDNNSSDDTAEVVQR